MDEIGALQGAADTVRTISSVISAPLMSRVFAHCIRTITISDTDPVSANSQNWAQRLFQGLLQLLNGVESGSGSGKGRGPVPERALYATSLFSLTAFILFIVTSFSFTSLPSSSTSSSSSSSSSSSPSLSPSSISTSTSTSTSSLSSSHPNVEISLKERGTRRK